MKQGSAQKKLVKVLASHGFHNKYYGYIAAVEVVKGFRLDADTLLGVIAGLNIDLKFHKRERYYSYRRTKLHDIRLHISFTDVGVELVLALDPGCGFIGGTFASLALDALRLDTGDKNYEPEPPYPDVPFSSEDQLANAIRFGVDFFHEIEDLVATEKW